MIPVFQFPFLNQFPELIHGITTRKGGVSKPPYESLNTGMMVGDEREAVLENRRLIAEWAGLTPEKGILPQLTHSNHVAIVTGEDAGRGYAFPETIIKDTDALITREKELLLVVTLADCTPVFLYDRENQVIAVAHSGWKGTIGRIAENTLLKMKDNFGTKPENVYAGIGVTIGECCYEVSESLATEFEKEFGSEVIHQVENQSFLNLTLSSKIQLLQSGVPEKNIETAGICTACNVNTYFSHRKERGLTGRFCAVIALR